jgi:hypothetical protein
MAADTDSSSTAASSTCAPGQDCGLTIGTHPHPTYVELFVVAAVALIVGFVFGRLFSGKNVPKVNKDV